MPKVDVALNVILDADICGAERLSDLARVVADNGATLIQYRDKRSATHLMIERARTILVALRGYDIPLLINDRVDVALAVGAQGVHLGRDDMAPGLARRLLGEAAIIGVTVKATRDLSNAGGAATDYACIGGVFATTSKDNPDTPVGLSGLTALASRLRGLRPDLPIGAIAGITADNAAEVIAAGADGIAVIGAIATARNPAAATRQLRGIVDAARGPA